jgi:hypothetical protein
MNSFQIREYFISRYQNKFCRQYIPNIDRQKEIYLINNFKRTHSDYLILEAIDQFINLIPQDKAHIAYFLSLNFFNSKFEFLIRLNDVIKYRRLLPFYPQEDQNKIKRLIQEYEDYSNGFSLSLEDVTRKKEIVSELNNFALEK